MINIGDKPLADFNDPIGMLRDCHRRIERFLNLLRAVDQRCGPGVLDGEGREAIAAALNYFSNFAPRHTADEEESLFPRMRNSGDAEALAVLANLDRLEQDHRRCEECHAAAARIAGEWLEKGWIDRRQHQLLRTALDELAAIYTEHIRLEDTRVFVIASRVLKPEQLGEIGEEMARRRSLTKGRYAAADSGKP